MRVIMDTADLKFKLNEVDCLIHLRFEVEVEGERIDSVKALDSITQRLHAVGATCEKPAFTRNATEGKTGATGFHPADLEPAINGNGKPMLCPDCGQPLLIKRWIAGQKSKTPGKPYAKYVHQAGAACKYEDWLPEEQATKPR